MNCDEKKKRSDELPLAWLKTILVRVLDTERDSDGVIQTVRILFRNKETKRSIHGLAPVPGFFWGVRDGSESWMFSVVRVLSDSCLFWTGLEDNQTGLSTEQDVWRVLFCLS